METVALILARISIAIVSFSCSSICVSNGAAEVEFISPASINLNISAVGLNGLDTGSVTPSTWYYMWAISDGVTLGGEFSTSKTAPTLPAGYSYKKLLGVCRTDSSSQIIGFIQNGGHYTQSPLTAAGPTNWSTTTLVSLTNFVPDIACYVHGTIWSTATAKDMAFFLSGKFNQVWGSGRSCSNVPAVLGATFSQSFSLSISNPALIIGTSNSTYSIDITGWDINL